MAQLGEPRAARECGTCTLCCKLMAIVELAKPPNLWCPHCAPGRGCKIYPDRPAECRSFACLWLQSDSLPEEAKPERSKIVVTVEGERNQLVAHVDPAYPDAWKSEPWSSWLRQMAIAGAPHSRTVLVRVKNQLTALLPDRDVPLGQLEEDDRILLTEVAGPYGSRLEVTVVKASTLPVGFPSARHRYK